MSHASNPHTQSWVPSTITGSSITVTSVIGRHHTLCRDEVLVRYDHIPFTPISTAKRFHSAHRTTPHKRHEHIAPLLYASALNYKTFWRILLFKPAEVLQFCILPPPPLKLTLSKCAIISWLLEGMKMKTLLTLG